MKQKLKIILIIFFITILFFNYEKLICRAEIYNTYNEEEIVKEKYEGEIHFLSFETLMSFPEKALSKNNSYSNNYDENKITMNEFKKIIEQLYENNYILVDIFDLIDNQTKSKKELILPVGKIPLVLTFSNVTYKSNYQNMGQIDKIIIDRNNNLASYTTKKSIQDRIQYDNEFVLILESFIKTHKDFSFNNAKGIMFFSGENGILGYNTNHKNTSSKYEKKRAIEVIQKLKKLGWKFGSNNYNYSNDETKTDIEFAKQLSLWNSEIKDIIGNTNLYEFNQTNFNDISTQKLELLMANNFSIFFNQSDTSCISFYKDICTISSIKICGNSLRNNSHILSNYFDCKDVYDSQFREISLY